MSKLDYDVTGIDKKENQWIGSLNHRIITGDLLYENSCKKLPRDIDLIIHLAAHARVYELVKNPLLALQNIVATFNVLEFARKNDIDRIIVASSRETYGNIFDNLAISEEMINIGNCESPYSASKISSEALAYAYSKVYGINFVVTRFSNVYGMYDDSDRVIPLWIKQTLSNRDLIVYGKDKVLDFTYIDDAIGGILKIVEKFGIVKGNVFNIAFGKGTEIVKIAQEIVTLLNGESKIIIKENRPGEVCRFEADITKARKLLDYEPKINIEEGLMRTVQWYKRFYSS